MKSKDFGYIIDYIGIHSNMMEALKTFGGNTFGPSEDDVQQALGALIIELDLIKLLNSWHCRSALCAWLHIFARLRESSTTPRA